MHVYLDTEFTGFDRRRADLLSVAVLAEDDRLFYGEFADADWARASAWVREHIPPLLGPPSWMDAQTTYVRADRAGLRQRLVAWLHELGEAELVWWTDAGAYDWVYTLDWLADEHAGNAYAWAQAQGLRMAYQPRDLTERLPLTVGRQALARHLLATSPIAEADPAARATAAIIGGDTAHAAWADAVVLRFLQRRLA